MFSVFRIVLTACSPWILGRKSILTMKYPNMRDPVLVNNFFNPKYLQTLTTTIFSIMSSMTITMRILTRQRGEMAMRQFRSEMEITNKVKVTTEWRETTSMG